MERFSAIAFDSRRSRWLGFARPSHSLVANSPAEVPLVLDQIDALRTGSRVWALGWVSYEAAPAFDSSLTVARPHEALPLAWFGLFPEPTYLDRLPTAPETDPLCWEPSISEATHNSALAQIRNHIARGDTYQVNFSFRLRAAAPSDPYALFRDMIHEQRGSYSIYLDTGRFVIASASPELFFERSDTEIVCRPMKGTAPRGPTSELDDERARALAASDKERAENIMVVDMVRNDLSKIASPGSVVTDSLCAVERYPRLLQMTSEVRAHSAASLSEIFRALFPSASITGAPKRRTIEIISALESSPRGIYTGAVGVLPPEGRAWFNVAIRTAVIDRDVQSVEYGVGSGVVWDSSPRGEFQECMLKASAIARPRARGTSLFETILWDPARGFSLLERHLARLAESAEYFGIPFDQEGALVALHDGITGRSATTRARLTLREDGTYECTAADITALPSPYTVSLATLPVDSNDPRLCHKTTDRSLYDEAEPENPNALDIILWNERGEITESRIANIAIALGGRLFTPPITSGLLAGCLRAELLHRGELQERVIHKNELARADGVYLLNSLRGMWQVELLVSAYTERGGLDETIARAEPTGSL